METIRCNTANFGDPTAGAADKECCIQSPGIPQSVSPIVNTIECGQTAKGLINVASDAPQYYKLTTTATADITVDNCGSAFDTNLDVFDSGSNQLNTDNEGDDSGSCPSNLNEDFTISAVPAGVYIIRLKAYSMEDEFGTYAVSVSCAFTAEPTGAPSKKPTK